MKAGILGASLFLVFIALAMLQAPAGEPAPSKQPPPADTIVSLMHQAAAQRKRGDYAAAVESYRKVLRRAPGLYEARLFLADTLHKEHRGSEAETEFLAARRIKPAEPFPYLGLADLRREAFRYDEAGAFLDEGLAAVSKEKTEPLLVARGLLLREAGDFPGSLAKLQEAAGRFPESGRVKEGLGLTLMTLGRVDEAVATFEASRAQAPDAPSIELELRESRSLAESLARAEAGARAPSAGAEAWTALARLRFVARQYPQSVQAAEEALRRAKGRGDLLLLKARALEALGRLPEARAELEKISRKSPEHLTSLYHLAWLARKRDDAAGEERIWGEALKYYPADPGAALMRVLCWKRGGELEDRDDLLKKAGGGKEASSSARLLQAMAAEELGRAEDAARAYAAMLRAEPGNPEVAARLSAVLARSPQQLKAWLESTQGAVDGTAKEDPAIVPLRALLLETAGRHAEALTLLRQAAVKYPDRADVALSFALRLEGSDEEMKEQLERAVALDPSSPWPRLHKGLLLLKSGDAAGARREAEAAKAIAPKLPEAWQLAGSAARVEADYPAAVQQLSQALLLDPSDSLGVTRVQLALAHAGAKNSPASREALEGDLPPFPDLIYRLAWAFVDRNFLDRAARGSAWPPLRDAFTDPHAGPAQAYAAVAASLASLGDPYTRLRSAQETEALYVRGRLEKMVTDAAGTPAPSSAAVVTGDLGGDIGYLRLTTFSDPSARAAIRKALEEMAEKQGLVLDLRGNLGGLAAEADAVAGMLLEEGETLGFQRTAAGEEVQKVPQTRPAFGRKPLVILTDRRTGSAAEKLAAGLQGSGRAMVLGETTLGKGAGQMSRLLPGGAMLLVTAVESLTPAGEAIQGRGVVPDVPAEGDESLEKAREILENPPAPTP